MKIGEVYELNIDDISHDGWGVGRSNNMVVFVRGALPLDTVRTSITFCKKTYAKGRLVSVVKPSPHRILSDCDYFERCGGCTLRNFAYEAEISCKEKRVHKALSKIAHTEDYVSYDCMPCDDVCNYRNKAEYGLCIRDNEVVLGFMAEKSDEIVDVHDCKLMMAGINSTASEIRDILAGYKEYIGERGLHHVIIRQSNYNEEIMVIFVSGRNDYNWAVEVSKELSKRLEMVKSVHHVMSPARFGWNFLGTTTLIFGKDRITEKIGHVLIDISPVSFLQVNTTQAAKLYDRAKELLNLSNTEFVLDMYCGTGSIGLTMADSVRKVLGIEAVELAVLDAKHNAKLNNISNAEFVSDLAEDAVNDIFEDTETPDVIVLDPPRVGCDAVVLKQIAYLKVGRIAYISCNPETLARDIAILIALGYVLQMVQPVDMFPRTMHVETIALLQYASIS